MRSNFDIALLEKPVDEGLLRSEVMDLYDMLSGVQVLPLDLTAKLHESSALGFITCSCAEKLNYDYEGSGLHDFIAAIMDDMNLENETGVYEFSYNENVIYIYLTSLSEFGDKTERVPKKGWHMEQYLINRDNEYNTSSYLLNLLVQDDVVNVKSAVVDSCMEYCKTPEGRTTYECNCGDFNWGDFISSVPNEICEKHGIRKLEEPGPEEYDYDEVLVDISVLQRYYDDEDVRQECARRSINKRVGVIEAGKVGTDAEISMLREKVRPFTREEMNLLQKNKFYSPFETYKEHNGQCFTVLFEHFDDETREQFGNEYSAAWIDDAGNICSDRYFEVQFDDGETITAELEELNNYYFSTGQAD